MVGVAAAAVLLVIPAYLYHFKAIKKIVVFGELLAVTAVLMAISFIFVDFGRPDRFWHIIPFIGRPNFPSSILAWDMVVLNGYLFLNLFIAAYIGSCRYFGKEPNKRLVIPLILLSIPWAVGVHTVTAFVYNGLATRPFWSASILAPRFLASAFCSGPALMIIIFQILRKVMNFEIRDRAIFKLAEIIAYAMAINLFLMVAEIYKDYYSATIHISSMRYLYQGLHGHNNLVPWIWTAMLFNTVGFLLFITPWTRKNFVTLNTGCVLIFVGIWIEKGMGLIIPGFIPDTMGEIYEYMPSNIEVMISVGICGFGAMTYTLLVRGAVAVDTGKLRHPEAPPIQREVEEGPVAKDIMSKKVISVPPDTTVEAIARIFSVNRITGVPVVDEHNRIIGVVSESDIIIYETYQEPHLVDRLKNVILPEAHEREAKPGGIASEIMTVPVITAREETPLRELIQSTIEKKIKRIIIADDEGHPVGVVSRIDIVKALEHI
ncbi:MAG: CBS domain-containing protein, partial [Thermodesulfovibrionales bacterium]